MRRLLLVLLGLLVIGAVGCATRPTGEVGVENEARTITTKFVSKGDRLIHEDKLLHRPHEAIVIYIDRGDQVVWEGVDIDEDKVITDFSVSIQTKSQGAPPSPFTSGLREWKAENARVVSGRAVPAARDHEYKYKIEVDGKQPLDPHIIFR